MCAAQCGGVAEQKAEKASRVWLSPSLSFLAATKWTVPFCHTVLQPWCSAPVCRTLWNSEPKSVLPSLSCFCQEVQASNGYLSTLKGPEWPKWFHTSLYAPNVPCQGTYKPMYRFWEVIRTLVHCALSIYCSPLSALSRGAERIHSTPIHCVCSFPINLEPGRQKLQTRAFKSPRATFVERSRL